MLTSRLFIVSTIAMIAVTYLSAQERGGQRGAAPAAPPMTLTVSGLPRGGGVAVKVRQAGGGGGARRVGACPPPEPGRTRRPGRNPSCSTCTISTSPATRRPTIRRTG